jgi:hypothetical protein
MVNTRTTYTSVNMKFSLILFLLLCSRLLLCQSSDSLYKEIDWLKSHYPDKQWMKVSSAVMDRIFSMHKNYVIYGDPVDSLTKEISKYAHVFIKVYTFSCFEFYDQHKGKKNSLEATLFGIDNVIKYYPLIIEKDSTYKSNAIEYYKSLQITNKLKDHIIYKTKYLKKNRLQMNSTF